MCKIADKVKSDFNRLGELITDAVIENRELRLSNDLKDVVVESTDDVVYIVEVETYKIVYLNSEARRIFGDAIGEHCYNAFQGNTSICQSCNMQSLLNNVGKPIKDVVYNQHLNKLYYTVDVVKEVNGKLLRFERAINLNGEAKKVAELYEQYKK